MVRLQSKSLRGTEYLFITITPRTTQTLIDRICQDQMIIFYT